MFALEFRGFGSDGLIYSDYVIADNLEGLDQAYLAMLKAMLDRGIRGITVSQVY